MGQGTKGYSSAAEEECAYARPVKYNSAFRLCYSLQLIPYYNEKHQLITVYPIPPHRKMADQEVEHRRHKEADQEHSILWVPIIFLVAAMGLYFMSFGLQNLDSENSTQLNFPTSLEEIRLMSSHLVRLKESHYAYLLALFGAAYVFKQTFAIPGSFFLNLLGGALFGPHVGFALCTMLNGIGATFCFLLSQTFGKSHVVRYFPREVKYFQDKMEENKDGLFFFLLFLRLFPMSPNWAMNIVAPIVGVPIHLFFLTVVLGMIPYNFICAQTGCTLSQISSVSDVFTWWTMAKLMLIAVAFLTPGLVIKKLRPKEE